MPGHDHLRGGGHTHGIGADQAEIAVFGRRFIAGAGAGHIDAFLQLDAFIGGNLLRHADEVGVVRAGHVRETGAEILQIRADERVGQQVDMVADDHEVSHVVVQVGGPGGVGHEQIADAQADHHPDGEGDQVHAVAFVIVDASLHGNHVLARQFAHDEIAFMADGRGDGEARDVLVGDNQRVLNLFGQLAQSAAQDDPHNGTAVSQAFFQPGFQQICSQCNTF